MIRKLNENLKVTENGTRISKECVNFILKNFYKDVDFKLIRFNIKCASDNMIGFLSDYWRLEIDVHLEGSKKKLQFFIKAICHNNAAKAAMVNEMKLLMKEILFYDVIKRNINLDGLKKWCPNLIAYLDDAMIYEDLTYLGYKNRDKLCRFDLAHTFQALDTLATFHSISLIYEENKRKKMPAYSIYNDYEKYLDVGGYCENSLWFVQCTNGALEAVYSFSKHRENINTMKLVEEKWKHVWNEALKLCDYSTIHRNVICHRDLWNNNILFHYKECGEPDGCIFVDYQAIKLQPPAGDVMTLLHCNLDPEFREKNMDVFLNYYYDKLNSILEDKGINIVNVLPKDEFVITVEKQRQWGLIVSACLIPQIMINDELLTNIFTNTERFEDIMTRRKGDFIKEMMNNDKYYRDTVMEIFDEIIDRYIIKGL